MNSFWELPPGFRFHPTEEELVDYYLRRKVASRNIDFDIINDVDLYKIEPWDLQGTIKYHDDALCRIGVDEEQKEWYFFSHKDKKYPTGTRTNRATVAGFWKATGRDKTIYSKTDLVGMRKTLVFYKGRAPNGLKSDWIMHEYHLETDENAPPKEEGWVVCRVFKKRTVTRQKLSGEHVSPMLYYSGCSAAVTTTMPEMESSYPYKNVLPMLYSEEAYFPPLIETSKIMQCGARSGYGSGFTPVDSSEMLMLMNNDESCVSDWSVLDDFVASQFSSRERGL